MAPYFEISQLNSLRFVKESDWNNHTNLKNARNTLSYQEDGVNNCNFYHLLQTDDNIKIQFKSNYADHNAELIDCQKDHVDLGDVDKLTNNLGHKDNRTCTIQAYGLLTVMYFGEGDVLDYDTGSVIDDYEIGIYPPSWMKKGVSVTFSSGSYTETSEVIGIAWVEEANMYGVLTSIQTPQQPLNGKVKTLYNIEDYEIFQFELDCNNFDEGKYQVEISAFAPGTEDLIILSERIHLKPFHENTYLIKYSHNKNNQINYSYGIEHLIRVPYHDRLSFNPSGKNSIHKTDGSSYFVDSENYEEWSVSFEPVPTGIAMQLSNVFSVSNININSRNFIAEDKPSIKKIDDSNLYTVEATLLLKS